MERKHKRRNHDFDKPHTTVTRSVKVKRGGEVIQDSYDVFEEDEDTLEQVRNPAYVGLNSCLTHNAGDGDFIKVGVSIEIPCRPNRDSLKTTTLRGKEFVRARIRSEFNAALRQLKSL